MAIDLKEFMEWYKKSEIEYEWKKRVFREPKIKYIQMPVMKSLEEYCIEWKYEEFKEIFEKELPVSQQKIFLEKILNELGLV